VNHRSARGEDRRYFLSLPAGYDPDRRYPVVFGLHGRNFDGKRMRDYLGLEQGGNDWAIFVYPDALSRTFATETAIGWELGAVSSPYAGPRDVEFFEEMVRDLRASYCVDETRVFATGQSWGADFSLLLGCVRGNLVAGVVAVGGAGDYFLPKDTTGRVACPTGEKAFWGMHGKGDTYFAEGTYGKAYREGYLRANRCSAGSPAPLTIGGGAPEDECWEYAGCAKPTRWCSYASSYGHQIPNAYYARETNAFLRGL
jgi:polyhydroxybutyrate depolymerase